MKTNIWKSETGKQYTSRDGLLTICVLRSAWRMKFDVPKSTGVSLFYGSAWGTISRKFAADLIRQTRKDVKLIGGGK